MQIHNVKREHSNAVKKRVGRGGKRGKTSGRGMKGQKSRAGNKKRPEMRDIIKKLPKQRGHGKNRSRTVNDGRKKFSPVNLSTLEANFQNGDSITAVLLLEKGLVRRQNGKLPQVKILGNGEVSKKFTIVRMSVSASAKEKLEKSGGTIA